jgi:polyphosphate kinase 2 (PPK2 family)
MGRKRNQGKARKAAKAMAREAEEERANNDHRVEQLLTARLQQLQVGTATPQNDVVECFHGRDSAEKISVHFVTDFKTKYHEAALQATSFHQIASK